MTQEHERELRIKVTFSYPDTVEEERKFEQSLELMCEGLEVFTRHVSTNADECGMQTETVSYDS